MVDVESFSDSKGVMAFEVYEALGERVARLRRTIDLTQEALGRRVNMSRATVASIEAGRQRVTLEQLYELATALELKSLGELVPLEIKAYEPLPQTLHADVNPLQAAQIDTLLRSVLAGGKSK